jgi:hypothetical protein
VTSPAAYSKSRRNVPRDCASVCDSLVQSVSVDEASFALPSACPQMGSDCCA